MDAVAPKRKKVRAEEDMEVVDSARPRRRAREEESVDLVEAAATAAGAGSARPRRRAREEASADLGDAAAEKAATGSERPRRRAREEVAGDGAGDVGQEAVEPARPRRRAREEAAATAGTGGGSGAAGAKKRQEPNNAAAAAPPATVSAEEALAWFRVEQELGCFEWRPAPVGGHSARDTFSEAAILAHLGLERSAPPPLQAEPALPASLLPGLKLQQPCVFPYDMPCIAPAAVAAVRGLDLSTVDFVMGGSALGFLTCSDHHMGKLVTMRAQRVGNLIFLKKVTPFARNLGELGVQAEYAVTGRALPKTPEAAIHFHTARVVKLGKYRVLIAAEVDAWHQGAPAEVKTGKLRGAATFLQLLSSGCEHLARAQLQGCSISQVSVLTRAEVQRNLQQADLQARGQRATKALKVLRKALAGGDRSPVHTLTWESGELHCKAAPIGNLLPDSETVRRMAGLGC